MELPINEATQFKQQGRYEEGRCRKMPVFALEFHKKTYAAVENILCKGISLQS